MRSSRGSMTLSLPLLVLSSATLVTSASPPALDGRAAAATEMEATAERFEIVFVLDTTASMGSMIRAAKETIWSIVRATFDRRVIRSLLERSVQEAVGRMPCDPHAQRRRFRSCCS